MDNMILDPLENYEQRLKNLHYENTVKFFDSLVSQSGVNIEENRKTVEEYNLYKENIKKLRRKYNLYRFLRVLMIITLVLIPLVFLKMTPAIRKLREELQNADSRAEELLNLAKMQMRPLNDLFTDRDAISLIEQTVPLMKFDEYFLAEREEDMKVNYDFTGQCSTEESTTDVLSGEYNENPFLFENKLVHTMGMETYYGYKTIWWTETYRDSSGKMQSRRKSERLKATVTKPKPYYNTQAVLNYGSQMAPDLSFSRDASHLDRKSEKEIERYVKKGEKKLKRLTDKAIRENDDFMSMSNSDFEVLFDALDRTDEVQFRTMFTPLAQTNMVDLILSKSGYGDDFSFIKLKRMNIISSKHSQGREFILQRKEYVSYSYDIIRESFISKNTEYFKAVYFDFAPLLAIPSYQERPVQSLKPIPPYKQKYSQKECEALLNMLDRKYVVHQDTRTEAILKSQFSETAEGFEKVAVTAYSYDIEKRTDIVSVRGGDGRYYDVPVEWNYYIPLQEESEFYVGEKDKCESESIMASRKGLCIFKK